jgi:hypothetical protein
MQQRLEPGAQSSIQPRHAASTTSNRQRNATRAHTTNPTRRDQFEPEGKAPTESTRRIPERPKHARDSTQEKCTDRRSEPVRKFTLGTYLPERCVCWPRKRACGWTGATTTVMVMMMAGLSVRPHEIVARRASERCDRGPALLARCLWGTILMPPWRPRHEPARLPKAS